MKKPYVFLFGQGAPSSKLEVTLGVRKNGTLFNKNVVEFPECTSDAIIDGIVIVTKDFARAVLLNQELNIGYSARFEKGSITVSHH